MKTTPFTASIAATLLATLMCPAQEAPAGGPPPHPPQPVLEALDTDADGTISAEEIKAAAESLLALDADGDGALSLEELRPRPPEDAPEEKGKARRGPRGPVPPLLAVLDGDGDKALSADEIEAAPESLAELDKNEDGEITGRELHPPRGRREGPEGDEDGGRPAGPPPGGRGPGGPPRGR
jgi:hypothetical protein